MIAHAEQPRILFVSQGYPPLDGGVATSAARVARNLSRHGCVVAVMTFDYSKPLTNEDFMTEEDDGEIRVRRLGPFPRHHGVDENDLAVARRRVYDRMEPLARAFAPDIVLSFYAGNAGLLAAYLAGALRVPHIVGLRGNDIGRNIFSTYWLYALNRVLSRADCIVCVNTHLRRRLLLAFPEMADKTHVVLNGVQLPGVGFTVGRPYLTQHTGWTDAVVAVFIGTPREKKGVRVLLAAVKEVSARRPLRLLVVGPEVKEAEAIGGRALWNELKQQGILHATGLLPRERALEIAAEGDIVLMPSVEDGLANGLLEGMALGLCPVVSDIFCEIVEHNISGLVVKRNDREELARCLEMAVDTPSLRKRLGDAARTRIENRHDPADEASRYLELCRQLITGHDGTGRDELEAELSQGRMAEVPAGPSGLGEP